MAFPLSRWRWYHRAGKCRCVHSSTPREEAKTLHPTTIRFGDRAYTAIGRAADAQGISISQYVREAALIRAVLDQLEDEPGAFVTTTHDILALAREVRRLSATDES
jgi:uncharacterized protein (DUF1778 family)